MSFVSLCVIVFEVIEEIPPFTSSYLTPKYSMSSEEGKGKLVLEKGDKTKARGKRQPRTMTVETYAMDDEKSEKNPAGTVAKSSQSGQTSKANFFSGNPDVEMIKGVIHFYKENERTPVTENKNALLSQMLCMVNVPANVTCRDLLQFVAPFQSDIENVKIIRDATPNQYMVLIKFKTAGATNSFYKTYNGVTFNTIEDDMCTLVYVSRIETMRDEDGAGLPLAGHTELPICPVCLERMEESVDGVLTILCNHSFHSTCLSKWSDSSCPVCRYVQTPEMVSSNQCCECQSSENLWICLICGHVGCGRYINKHAYRHFCETSHCYAIQPDNNRVWDYVSDTFVHRLLQNKPDGKLVAVSGAEQAGDCEGEDPEGKLDSMHLEFSYLLSSQLETQTNYWKECMDNLRSEMKGEIDALTFNMDSLTKQNKKLETRVSSLEKEKADLERKLAQMTAKLAKTTAEYKEEQALNNSLSQSQKEWAASSSTREKECEKSVAQYKAEISELKEQLRDLMFYIDAQNKIEESPLKDEIQDGTVTVGEKSQKPTGSRKKRR